MEKDQKTAEHIQALAREHGVTAERSQLDDFADAVTRLAGDDVELDETEQLLVALTRKGILTAREMSDLAVAYRKAG